MYYNNNEGGKFPSLVQQQKCEIYKKKIVYSDTCNTGNNVGHFPMTKCLYPQYDARVPGMSRSSKDMGML